MFRPLKLKISKWIVSIKLTNWCRHFAWCDIEFTPERGSTYFPRGSWRVNLWLHLCNELPEGKLFNFSRFSIKEGSWLRQGKGLMWKSWFIEMLMMVLAAWGYLLSDRPALLSSTSLSPTGYMDTTKAKNRKWDPGSLHIYFIIFFWKSKWDFPGGSVVKNPPASVEDADSISGSGRSTGKRNGNPLGLSEKSHG